MNLKVEKKQYETPVMKQSVEGKVREAGIIIVVVVLIAAG